MIAIESLKSTLENYKENKIPSLSKEIIDEMIVQIGNPDSYIRDRLIYGGFCKLLKSKQLNNNEMSVLLERMLAEDKLFYKIGESNTDSVFTRSFSSLVVAAILETNVDGFFVTADKVKQTGDKIILYLKSELDLRGYVEEKGWSHAIAHGADALDALAKQALLPKQQIQRILDAMERVLLLPVDYLDEEEERLAMILISLITYQKAEQEVIYWLNHLFVYIQTEMEMSNGSINAYHAQRTVKNFLKSFYMIMQSKEIKGQPSQIVFEVLEKWMYLK